MTTSNRRATKAALSKLSKLSQLSFLCLCCFLNFNGNGPCLQLQVLVQAFTIPPPGDAANGASRAIDVLTSKQPHQHQHKPLNNGSLQFQNMPNDANTDTDVQYIPTASTTASKSTSTSTSTIKSTIKSTTATATTTTPLPDSSDPHTILNVHPTASQEEITNAYRQAALQYHPYGRTKSSSTLQEREKANDDFARINAAYVFLTGDDAPIQATVGTGTGTGSSTKYPTSGYDANTNTQNHLDMFHVLEEARIAKVQQEEYELLAMNIEKENKMAEERRMEEERRLEEQLLKERQFLEEMHLVQESLLAKAKLEKEARLARLSGLDVGQRLVEEQWLAEERRRIEAAIGGQLQQYLGDGSANSTRRAQDKDQEQRLIEKTRLAQEQSHTIAASKMAEITATKAQAAAKAAKKSKQQQIAADILKSVTANQIKRKRE